MIKKDDETDIITSLCCPGFSGKGVKPYKFMDDMTFVGVPLFIAGWALKGDKGMFRVNAKADQGGKKNTQLLTDFKTRFDDYLQFFGPAMTVGLKLGGYEGRSDWPRLLASAGIPTVLLPTRGPQAIRQRLSWVLPCCIKNTA